MIKRKNLPVKKGIKSYLEVIPKPPQKWPRGCPRKPPAAPALDVVDNIIHNNEVDTDKDEQHQSSFVQKGSSYIDCNQSELAAVLKEAIDFSW